MDMAGMMSVIFRGPLKPRMFVSCNETDAKRPR